MSLEKAIRTLCVFALAIPAISLSLEGLSIGISRVDGAMPEKISLSLQNAAIGVCTVEAVVIILLFICIAAQSCGRCVNQVISEEK